MVRMHPNADLLADYCAGGLSPAPSLSVSAHLHFCARCRDNVNSLEEVGGVLLEAVTPMALSASALDSVLAKTAAEPVARTDAATMDPELSTLPKLIHRLIPDHGVRWSSLSPALKIARIPVGESRFELALHKIRPGGSAPAHDHKGLEITVVLEGSFSDDDGVYQEGDFIVREPGHVHTPMATQNARCICLSACEAPIRMIGPFKRLLNPFVRFTPA